MSRDTPRCVVRQSAASRFAAGLPSALRGARNRARNWQAQERTFDSCFRVCVFALGWVCRSSPFFKPAFCCAGSYPGSLQGWFTSVELVGPTRSVLRARGPVTSPVTMLVVWLCERATQTPFVRGGEGEARAFRRPRSRGKRHVAHS